ncbi:unnamed protein product, partial [Notodromas monacha]
MEAARVYQEALYAELECRIGILQEADKNHKGWWAIPPPIDYLRHYSKTHGNLIQFGHLTPNGILGFARDHNVAFCAGLSLLKTPNDYPIYPCVGRPPYWSCNGGIVEGQKVSAKHTHTGTAGRTGQCLVMPYYKNPDATGAEGNIFKKFITSEWFLQEEPFNLEIILPRAKNADTTTPYHRLAVGSLVELKTSPILGIVMIMTEA